MISRCDLLPQYKTYKKAIDKAIRHVLFSGRYILGGEVEKFEKEFSKYTGVSYGIGVGNATDGLTLSLTALGIGRGDEVITTAFTAIPTVSAIIDSGATPVFVDISPDTFLMDLDKVADAITPQTKAVMPVHIFGNVVDIPKLKRVIGSKITIIEDAAQAHGSQLNGTRAGSMGDIGVFSFYPTKNLGAYGDGGMVVTNNKRIADTIKLLRMYGMTDKDHIIINGANSRLDELQAAVLRVKLKYLDEMNEKRNRIARQYLEGLNPGLMEHQKIKKGVYSNYHIFSTRVKANKRKRLMRYLENKSIQTNVYYPVPLHLQKANRFLEMKKSDLSVTEKLCKQIMALPMYAELDEGAVDFIITTINKF